jgi:Uma2 family endonuclease
MVDAGILGPEDKVELIEGEILLVGPENALHASVIDRALLQLMRAFGQGYYVRPCHPVAIDESSEPEPDLAVVPGNPDDYRREHPVTALLLVEVSRTSRAFDRGRKLRLYARNGIPEYWVLDLVDDCLYVHRDPSSDGYRTVLREERGATVTPLSAKTALGVSDLLGG